MKNPHEIILDDKISKMRSTSEEKRREKIEKESNLSIWLPAMGVLFCNGIIAFLYINLKKPDIQPADFSFFALQLLFLSFLISNARRSKNALSSRIKTKNVPPRI